MLAQLAGMEPSRLFLSMLRWTVSPSHPSAHSGGSVPTSWLRSSLRSSSSTRLPRLLHSGGSVPVKWFCRRYRSVVKRRLLNATGSVPTSPMPRRSIFSACCGPRSQRVTPRASSYPMSSCQLQMSSAASHFRKMGPSAQPRLVQFWGRVALKASRVSRSVSRAPGSPAPCSSSRRPPQPERRAPCRGRNWRSMSSPRSRGINR
mmetsp:Transcript_20362/g.51263  ORF Transcript_20362/g.51263 Transcript_20362/m.51263 type:complete len:204 (-) Transcript_20362:248-859(-)